MTAPMPAFAGAGVVDAPAPVAPAPKLPYAALAAATRRHGDDEETVARRARFEDFQLPIGLIALGTLLAFFEARLTLGSWNIPIAIAYVGISTVINLALIFAALMITARLLDLGLGEVGPAMLKVTAVAILPAAVGGIINEWAPMGYMTGYLTWFVTFALYCLLLWLHFDMDFQEITICTTLIWLIRTWVGLFLFLAIFKLMFGAAAGPTMGGMGAGLGNGTAAGGGTNSAMVVDEGGLTIEGLDLSASSEVDDEDADDDAGVVAEDVEIEVDLTE